jgi:nicotinamidase-related amidase
MNVADFEIKNTAMLFFDILNGYYHLAEPAAKSRMKPMVDNAVWLMKACRASSIPIFFAKGNHRPDGATSAVLVTDTNMGLKPWPGGEVIANRPPAIAGDPTSDVIPELEPRPDDTYILKYRWSTFHQTYFDLALRARGIDTIIVSGGSTDVGVASTVYSARDLDYYLIIARDACASGQSEEINNMFMDRIFPRMGRVRTTDQVLQMIQGAGGKIPVLTSS